MKWEKFSAFFLALFSLFLFLPLIAGAKVSIIGGLSHERTVEGAKTYQGAILLQNKDEEPQEVKIYQTDYLFFSDGRNIYGELPGQDPRSNAKWITFSPHRLTIPGKATSAVGYTIKVPDDKSLVGTYWSMLMVEPIAKESPEAEVLKPEEEKIKIGIEQVVRYGIQMVVHIGDTGRRELKFLNTKLLKEQQKRVLQIDIENIGERLLRSRVWAELYNKEGQYVGKFEGGFLGTYPGTSVRHAVDLSEVPEGKYQALIVADCGGDDVFGMTYTLKLKEKE